MINSSFDHGFKRFGGFIKSLSRKKSMFFKDGFPERCISNNDEPQDIVPFFEITGVDKQVKDKIYNLANNKKYIIIPKSGLMFLLDDEIEKKYTLFENEDNNTGSILHFKSDFEIKTKEPFNFYNTMNLLCSDNENIFRCTAEYLKENNIHFDFSLKTDFYVKDIRITDENVSILSAAMNVYSTCVTRKYVLKLKITDK